MKDKGENEPNLLSDHTWHPNGQNQTYDKLRFEERPDSTEIRIIYTSQRRFPQKEEEGGDGKTKHLDTGNDWLVRGPAGRLMRLECDEQKREW